MATAPPVLPYTYFEGAGGAPPCESPPPLPPRERESPLVHSVLSNSPALVNDAILITDKKKPVSQSEASVVTRPIRSQAGAKTLPPKRASTGVLFGVKAGVDILLKSRSFEDNI